MRMDENFSKNEWCCSVGTIYAFEFVGAEYRAAMGAFAYILFDLGMMFLSPLVQALKI